MTPHMNTRRAAALAAVAAMVVVGMQTGAANAVPDNGNDGPSATRSVVPFSANKASVRTAAIKSAQSDASATADSLGLGGKEKLVVRDVIKDADGTVHTRYERTYDGLPVLGGDLVTHTAPGGKLKGVTKATKARISVPSTTPKIKTAAAARKVIWAGSGKPVLALETVKTGKQKDGTPKPAAHHHRRDHRQEAPELRGGRDRCRQQPVQRRGRAVDDRVRFRLRADRRRPRRPQDVRPQPGRERHR